MPIRIAPFTFQACSAAISARPTSDRAVVGLVRSPSETKVEGLATITPESFNPMKAMNRPMPPATAANSETGMALMISCRTPTRVRTRKATPERKTQPSAVSQGTPMPLTTV